MRWHDSTRPTAKGYSSDHQPSEEGTATAGKFGLDPHRLDDEALERELRYLYATGKETFFHGSRQALLNHTERMLELERETSVGSRSGPRLMRCGPARGPGARRASRPAANGRTSTYPIQATRDGGQLLE